MPASSGKPYLCALAISCFIAAGVAKQKPVSRLQIFQQIGHNLQELTAITGLPAKKQIRYDLITRDKVGAFLKDRVKESVKPEEVRAEELTLKKLGFVPQDFDLEKSTVDLLTEQAAAFYDYHKKRLYLTDWTSSTMQETALVHELAHALADQNFHLERFIKQSGQSDDSELARMAVMEGQATWLMAEVMARRVGRSVASDPALLDAMSGASEEGTSPYPVFNSVPLYLRETLIFPYTEGGRFQNAVYEKMGKSGFSEVFRHAPDTTQQILHPQKYFDHVEAADPEFPELTVGKSFKSLSDGMLGELDHSILIRQFGSKSQADEIAPHWRGGRYSLLENKSHSRIILQYASQWDSEGMARKFFHFYRQVLSKKWKKMEISSETENTISGTGDDGRFIVRLAETVVTSVEGLASPDQVKVSAVR
jgi:hypothetical protein